MNADAELAAAQARRGDTLVFQEIDRRLEVMFSEADTVGPEARRKLSGILKHYAKDPHPFTSCVRDNMKRFGPGRTERVCAVLKDIIRGTTHWRHGGDHGVAASDGGEYCPINLTDKERSEILSSLTDADFASLEEVLIGGR